VAVVTDPAARNKILTDIGDELKYHFAVRACAGELCDTNTVTRNVTLADKGAPTSPGITQVQLVSGVAKVTAPWIPAYGGVTARHIYRYEVANTSTACPADIGLYTEVNAVAFTDPNNPPIEMTALGTLDQNKKYCYAVRDEDPTGSISLNTAVRSVITGDLTKPSLPTTLALSRPGSAFDVGLVATWTASQNEVQSPLSGTSVYKFYRSEATHPALPSSTPCADGTLIATVDASAYNSGATVTYPLTTLTPRTNYRVCIQAFDSSNNPSDETPTSTVVSTGDLTAPAFFGLQTLAYNAGMISYDVGIVTSTASDVRDYKVKIQRTRGGSPLSDVVLTKTSSVGAGTAETLSFTLAEGGLQENDVLTLKVDACDNASPTFNAADNCSATAATLTRTVPDTAPPPGFAGITNAVPGAAHGQINISWIAPSNWSDYRGFKIYSVENGSLVFINNCTCGGSGNCVANPLTSCTLSEDSNGTALTPYRTYTWHVRAFDAVGNLTPLAFTGGSAAVSLGRVKDLEAPTFNASPAATMAGSTVKLKFTPAEDTQNTAAPDNGDLTYFVYRKVHVAPASAAFVCPLTPNVSTGGCDNLTPIFSGAASGLATESGKLVYVDSAIQDGKTHNYQVCVRDSSLNVRCQSGSTASIDVADVTAPSVAVRIARKLDGLNDQYFHFTVSDNITTGPNLRLTMNYNTNGFFPTTGTEGTVVVNNVYSAIGTGTFNGHNFLDASTLNRVRMPSLPATTSGNPTRWYRVEIKDEGNNPTVLTFTDLLDTPTISSVTRTNTCSPSYGAGTGESCFSDADTAGNGGDTLRIIGTNFANSSTGGGNPVAYVAGLACTTTTWVSSTEITCVTPAAYIPGTKNVTVLAWDQQSATLTSAFKYNTYCDLHGDETPFSGGDGTTIPYKICTREQLDDVRNNLSKRFDLAGDIDLSGYSFEPINLATSSFVFDGKGYTISNWTYNDTVTGNIALFGNIGANTPTFKNLVLSNFNLTSTIGRMGALIGNSTASSRPTIDNITLKNSSLSAAGDIGGIYGYVGGTSANTYTNIKVINTTISSTGNGAGGIFGSGTSANQTINGCKISQSTITSNAANVGGVIGSGGQVTNCKVINSTVRGVGPVGGITGANASNISWSSVVSSTVQATGGSAGGICAGLSANTTFSNNSVVDTSITATSNAGGIIQNTGTFTVSLLQNSFIGSLSGSSAGGLSGAFGGAPNDVKFHNNFAIGTATGSTNIGGLFGNDARTPGVGLFEMVKNYSAVAVSMGSSKGGWTGTKSGVTAPTTSNDNFWARDVATVNVPAPTYTYTGVTDMITQAALKTQSTYTSAGWDFWGETTNGTNDYWVMSGASSTLGYRAGGYPVLHGVSAVTCPTGYVYVPANAAMGVKEFCVAAFEMKNVGGVATSQAAGIPWMGQGNLTSHNACTALGSQYRLINNLQWNTIARNLENVAANWSSGVVGTGTLPLGITVATGSTTIQKSVSNLTDPCDQQTSCTFAQRRSMILSTGDIIWDFSGNASEWVRWRDATPDIAFGTITPGEKYPTAGSYTSGKNYGTDINSSTTESAYIYRGIYITGLAAGLEPGIFSLNTRPTTSSIYAGTGFRCVFNP
jgi:hypothetical protein